MKRFALTPTAIALAALTLSACSTQTTDSDVIQTDTIWANIKIASDGERSRISTELNVSGPGGNNLNLTAGDKLIVRAGGISTELIKDFDFLDIDYQGYVYVTASDALFTIALERPNDQDAQNSKVNLPAAFDIHSPIENQLYQANETIDIHWDGLQANKTIFLELASKCQTLTGSDVIQIVNFTIDDDGQHVINPNELEMFQNSNINKSKRCEMEIFLQRKNFGTTDPLFQSSSKISATQYRKVENVRIDLL